ncbi:MAG: carbohydrate-binding domain-containing protein, partial [Coprobacillaceae bacterium]
MKWKIALLIVIGLLLTGCRSSPSEDTTNIKEDTSIMATINLSDIPTYNGEGVSINNKTITINQSGTYVIEGQMSDGMVYIDATGEVTLQLNNMSLMNSDGPTIYATNGEKLTIDIIEGTENYVEDSRV